MKWLRSSRMPTYRLSYRVGVGDHFMASLHRWVNMALAHNAQFARMQVCMTHVIRAHHFRQPSPFTVCTTYANCLPYHFCNAPNPVYAGYSLHTRRLIIIIIIYANNNYFTNWINGRRIFKVRK